MTVLYFPFQSPESVDKTKHCSLFIPYEILLGKCCQCSYMATTLNKEKGFKYKVTLLNEDVMSHLDAKKIQSTK